jgi:hypothetical protein
VLEVEVFDGKQDCALISENQGILIAQSVEQLRRPFDVGE